MNQVKKSSRQNRKIAEHLLSSLTTAVIVLDKNLRVTRLNSAAEDLLHVSAGSVTASTDTQLIVEHSGNAGITVLSPANSVGQLSFGSPTDNRQGGISYNHDQNCLYLRAGQNDRMRVIGSTGQVFINESTNAGNGDSTQYPMLTVKMKDSNSTGEILGL